MTSRKGDPAAWAACRGNPKLHAAVESHPNVEKHDVRMGHPALAHTLLDTLDGTNEFVSIEEAWDAEVARRIEELKAGKAVTVPWEELHRELLAMVKI